MNIYLRGMQFSNPGLLWLLFLAIIPVIIHLFKFRRYRKVSFTRVDLLKLILVKTGFGNKLKKLVVMTLRMLAISAVVFAFAKPFIPSVSLQSDSMVNHCVVFIDNSPTLFADGIEGPLFESAKKSARAIVSDMPENFTFNLLSNTTTNQSIVLQKEEMLQEIDKLSIVFHRSNYKEALAAIKNFLTSNSVGIYISDFRKGFVADNENISDSFSSLFWVALPSLHNANIGIDSAWFESPQLLPNQMVTLKVKVSNYGKDNVEDIPLRLLENDQLVASTSASIEKENYAILSLQFNTGEQGWKKYTLSLPGDELNYDDDFYFACLVQKGSKIMALQADNKTNYLQSLLTSDAGFEFVSYKTTELPYDQLSSVDMVILEGISDLGSGLLTELNKFVDNGGALLLFPSEFPPHFSPDFFKSFGFNAALTLKKQPIQASLWDNQHPLLKGVFEKLPKNPELPLIHQYLDLSVLGKKEVLWKLKNNDPLFVQLKKGNGTVFVSSVGLNKDFGNLPLNPLFVPFMLRIAAFKNADQLLFDYTYQNQLQKISGVNLQLGQVYSFTNQSEEWIPEIVMRNNQQYLNHHRFVTSPGFYTLVNNQQLDVANFAFNVQSNLSVTALEDVEKVKNIAEKAGAVLVQDKPEFVANTIAQSSKGTPLWHYFVWASCLFLLLEMSVLKLWK
jgi:hypothetical protein